MGDNDGSDPRRWSEPPDCAGGRNVQGLSFSSSSEADAPTRHAPPPLSPTLGSHHAGTSRGNDDDLNEDDDDVDDGDGDGITEERFQRDAAARAAAAAGDSAFESAVWPSLSPIVSWEPAEVVAPPRPHAPPHGSGGSGAINSARGRQDEERKRRGLGLIVWE